MSDQLDSQAETIEIPDVPPPANEPPAASTATKADPGKRAVAFIIDAVIGSVVSIAIPGVGGFISAIYMMLRDGLEFDFMDHRSIGKHVMKLHVESTDGAALDLMTSVRRNWMFAFGPLSAALVVIPILGWILIPFVLLLAFALGVTEIVLTLSHAEGRRIGDRVANTIVCED